MDQQQQQEAVNQVYQYAFKLKANGKTSDEIKSDLITQGFDETSAETVAQNVEVHYREIKKKAGDKNMLYGALWCIGGTVVTVATYSAASDGGGHYVVAWGAIIFGAVQFFKGVAQRV